MKSFLKVRYQPKGRKKTDLDVLNIRQTTEPVVLGLNERNAKTSTISACVLAAFMGLVTAIRAFMLRDLILSFSAVFLFAMALGIYRKNRACAVLAFLAHAINQLLNLVFNPGSTITSEGAETYFWFALAIGFGLFGGIIGTLAIHELEREKERVRIPQAPRSGNDRAIIMCRPSWFYFRKSCGLRGRTLSEYPEDAVLSVENITSFVEEQRARLGEAHSADASGVKRCRWS